MSCMYCDFEGKCELYDKDFMIDDMCYDDTGYCECEDDPAPSLSCDNYNEV